MTSHLVDHVPLNADPEAPVDPASGHGMDLDVWLPDAARGPGLLLIAEIFGVGPYIRAVAERLAAAGYVVAAPDIFWRVEPRWVGEHTPDGLTASLGVAGRLDADAAAADCVAALGHLAGRDEVAGRPGVIGFCLGGTLAYRVAVDGDPAVCVSYYGSGVPALAGELGRISCPTLLHFGREDPYIPAASVQPLADALPAHPHVVLNMEIAGHAFDNHEAPMFHEETAARAAWTKTMAFLAEHLPV